MNREQAIAIARSAALNYEQRAAYSYLPVNEAQAANWMPHGWVIDAIMQTADQFVSATIDASEPNVVIFNAAEAARLQQLFADKPDLQVVVEADDSGKLVALSGEQADGTVTMTMLSEGGDLRDTLGVDLGRSTSDDRA